MIVKSDSRVKLSSDSAKFVAEYSTARVVQHTFRAASVIKSYAKLIWLT